MVLNAILHKLVKRETTNVSAVYKVRQDKGVDDDQTDKCRHGSQHACRNCGDGRSKEHH
jgi:hypothetical protein